MKDRKYQFDESVIQYPIQYVRYIVIYGAAVMSSMVFDLRESAPPPTLPLPNYALGFHIDGGAVRHTRQGPPSSQGVGERRRRGREGKIHENMRGIHHGDKL